MLCSFIPLSFSSALHLDQEALTISKSVLLFVKVGTDYVLNAEFLEESSFLAGLASQNFYENNSQGITLVILCGRALMLAD